LLPQNRLNQILNSIERLRPMPTNVSRILMMLDDPMTTASEISEMVGLDQALAALVLQFANSATLGYGPVCSNLLVAVMRLGFRRIKTLLLGAAASGSLNNTLTGYRLGAGALWNHSIATAMAAQWLARYLGYPDPEEAYVSGLLHDIGKLVLDQFVQVDYSRLIQSMSQSNLLLWQAEERMFGIDHSGVGGLMAKKWNFPPVLVEAIRYHHAPSLAMDNSRLAAIINIANSAAVSEKYGSVDPHGHVIHPEAPRVLSIENQTLDKLMSELKTYLTTNN